MYTVLLGQPQHSLVRMLTFFRRWTTKVNNRVETPTPPIALAFNDTCKFDEVRQRNEMKGSWEERQCSCQVL